MIPISHFTVLVITDTDADGALDEALAPFDENMQVEPYEREEGKPEEFWATDMLIRDAAVPASPTAEQVAAAYNERYNEEGDDGEPGIYARDGVLYQTSRYNPKSKWDWWQMGGRWRGFFQLKPTIEIAGKTVAVVPGLTAEARLGEPGTFERIAMDEGKGEAENYDNKVDQARKGLIDFEAMRTLAGVEAETQYDAFEAMVKDHPMPKPFKEVVVETFTELGVPSEWDEFVKTHRPEVKAKAAALRHTTRELTEDELLDPELFLDEPEKEEDDRAWRKPYDEAMDVARKVYHAQPAIHALQQHDEFRFLFSGPHEVFFWGDPNGRQKYIDQARNSAFSTYAFVKDGEWVGKGEMGWFGVSRDESDEALWLQKFNEMLDSLPDSAVLTVIDCHI